MQQQVFSLEGKRVLITGERAMHPPRHRAGHGRVLGRSQRAVHHGTNVLCGRRLAGFVLSGAGQPPIGRGAGTVHRPLSFFEDAQLFGEGLVNGRL